MKKTFYALLLAVATLCIPTACDDSTSTIGSTLTGQNVEIKIDSSYQVSGHTVRVARIRPKTTEQLIGCIDIPAYGSLRTSNVMQFLPSTALDTANFTSENVDSLILTLRYGRGAFLGDSVAPMGISVYPLTDKFSEAVADTISSGFDPEGYYDRSKLLASKIYNASTFNGTSAEQAATYRDIKLRLDPNGDLGKRLYKAFEEHPEYYENGRTFSEHVFPELYFETSYGNGRMTQVSITSMSMYLRKIYTPEDSEELDTLDAVHTYYMVTPEVVNNNNLTYRMSDKLNDLITDGKALMVAPAAAEVELTFPIEDIISTYKANGNAVTVVNSLTFEIPADSIENGLGVAPPPYALLVLKKDRDAFFANNKLTDNVTSFYATYSKSSGSYSFSGMRAYFNEMLERDEIKPEDYTFSLVPVQVNFENLASSGYYGSSGQTESEILPYLTRPAMAVIGLDRAKIKFSYSLQGKK